MLHRRFDGQKLQLWSPVSVRSSGEQRAARGFFAVNRAQTRFATLPRLRAKLPRLACCVAVDEENQPVVCSTQALDRCWCRLKASQTASNNFTGPGEWPRAWPLAARSECMKTA